MKACEKMKKESFSCGYGLLSLCCSRCLYGPCRISPFDRERTKTFCEEDGDLIVTKNILKQVVMESLEELKNIKKTIEEDNVKVNENTRESLEIIRKIKEKYELSSINSKKELFSYFCKNLRQFLSPFSGEKETLFDCLYPKKAFPYIYKKNLVSGSLSSILFELMEELSKKSQDIENFLDKCLKASLHIILSKEIRSDYQRLIFQEDLNAKQSDLLKKIEGFNSNPFSFLILLMDKDCPFKEELNKVVKKFDQMTNLIFTERINFLSMIGRELYKKWQKPLSEMKMLAIVSSKYVSSTLGALVLGFNVTSFPLLPIHGSKKVEGFFTKQLQNKFNNRYIIFKRKEIEDIISNFFREIL